MGACLSSSSVIDSKDQKPSSAYVISTNGELRQYTVPINVSQVLQSEMPSEASFICNSDRLYFDDFIPRLDLEYQLQPGQIYFVLPTSKLQYRLSASEMAALAVKASAALEDLNKNNRRHSKKFTRKNKKSNSRISPMLLQVEDESRDNYTQSQSNYKAPSMGLGVSMRSASVRKLQRISSRRAKMAVRSFRKLMTIQEGSVLLFT